MTIAIDRKLWGSNILKLSNKVVSLLLEIRIGAQQFNFATEMSSILCFPTNAQTKTWIFLCKSMNTDKIAFLSKNSAEGQILMAHFIQSIPSNLSAISLLISCKCVSFMYTLWIINNMISHMISTCKFFKYFKLHTRYELNICCL